MQISYYEIYKEKIYDLLASTTVKNKTRVCVLYYVALFPISFSDQYCIPITAICCHFLHKLL